MYRIEPGAGEVAGTVRAIEDIGERLRRLGSAYGEWQHFEPEPYFDLRPHQAAVLLHIAERVSTVHAVCFVDTLLPSFQAALRFFLDAYVPARRAGDDVLVSAVMVDKWQQLTGVLRSVRDALTGDAAFLGMNASGEERSRWAAYWQGPLPSGSPATLTPALAETPTLTLAVTFPLPAYRQPGRLRRLRRARDSARSRHNRTGRRY